MFTLSMPEGRTQAPVHLGSQSDGHGRVVLSAPKNSLLSLKNLLQLEQCKKCESLFSLSVLPGSSTDRGGQKHCPSQPLLPCELM